MTTEGVDAMVPRRNAKAGGRKKAHLTVPKWMAGR